MPERSTVIYLISAGIFLLTISFISVLKWWLTGKREHILKRLSNTHVAPIHETEDILERPLRERTIGALSRWLVAKIGQVTPQKATQAIAEKLDKAGNPYNLKPSEFIAVQGIIGLVVSVLIWYILTTFATAFFSKVLLTACFGLLAVYLPWFMLARDATKRQRDIRRSLPDIMDLLVVSVEAGLAFDMALLKVVEKFKGTVAYEFHRALREMQLGKARKDALKDMSERVNLMELSSLVNAVIQSEQLGVGLGNVLRMQADLIREKRQQWIEEQAMKAPIKMLFPLVFCILPCLFIVILGPAFINIIKMFSK